MDIVLSKSTWPIIGWVCQILGWLINGIYFCLEKIGIPNIGIAIILYTIIIYLVLTPLPARTASRSAYKGSAPSSEETGTSDKTGYLLSIPSSFFCFL